MRTFLLVVRLFLVMFSYGSSGCGINIRLGYGIILWENTAMKVGDPTITLRCLTMHHVHAEELSEMFEIELTGEDVVYRVDWLEAHGQKVTVTSEYWRQLVPGTWLVMLPKK